MLLSQVSQRMDTGLEISWKEYGPWGNLPEADCLQRLGDCGLRGLLRLCRRSFKLLRWDRGSWFFTRMGSESGKFWWGPMGRKLNCWSEESLQTHHPHCKAGRQHDAAVGEFLWRTNWILTGMRHYNNTMTYRKKVTFSLWHGGTLLYLDRL